ncbi:MAG TPA: methyl-accepting chemotaxis protein, partial [Magnetospirillaceae bacterium]|nr:methyl-accepting chemotaxis protein [Magnetospirillaceae bacterium]
RTSDMVAAVSQGFLDMAKDLEAIQSIDADMRIMGLNATLKCGRLGDSGRALGVVAQELRSCSRRTEDTAKTIGDLLKMALASSRQLGESEGETATARGEAPQRVMERSIAGLSAVSAAMGESLDALRREAPALSQSLAGCADSLAFHHRLRSEADRVMALIEQEASRSDAGVATEADHHELRRHLEPLYTMDSEREVHDGFDGITSVKAESGSSSDSVDDLFF